jgi:Cu(I)/Ag(I) efflux system membrane fusion protein
MYARVSIFGNLRPSALTVPREALIRGGERDRLVVALGQGRFRVHEVLAGMESGEWVEIIAGIAEGDQVVTSAQFLLDSEASLAGSIQRLQGGAEVGGPQAPVRVFANGWVEDVNLERRRLRVSHGPIDQLGWPSMTMEFKVDPQVALDQVVVGGNIQFVLRQGDAGEFVIEQTQAGQATAPEPDPDSEPEPEQEAEPMEHDHG